MTNRQVPVILLDCHLRAIEGVIASFGKRKIPIVGLSSQKRPPAFFSRYLKRRYHTPPVSQPEAYLNFLLTMPDRGVLLYADDASASFVVEHAETLRKAGFRINIAPPATFLRGFDKALLAEAANEADVPVIPTIKVQQREDLEQAWEKLDKPIILKATRLAGGKFEIIRRKEELGGAFNTMDQLVKSAAFTHMNSGLIAQEFIHYDYDEIYCCESYYTTRAEATGFLSIHKIRPNINRNGTAGGRLFAGETIQDERLEGHSRRLLDHLQWQGLAHMDWIYSRKYQEYLLCEINPRLPGFSNLLTKTGFDMAYQYYADLCGLPLADFSFRKSLYFEALRMPGDITTGIYAIMKGYLPWKTFLRSYGRLFSGKQDICLDIFYGSDPTFTAVSWFEHLRYMLTRPFRFLRR
jgi:predicted ATP-grasp superfamily ATP-dependent carboligase